MASIKISDEYASLVPELSTQEYESLKQSIKENGLYLPIIVNQNGIILDGHHRYKACQELAISEPKTITREFKDKLDEKLFVIDCNLKRRQLNNFQKTELTLKSKAILDEIAKMNSGANLKQNLPSVRNLTVGKGSSGGRVDEQIGELAGVSRDTVRKVEKILENATQEDKQALRTGEKTINEIFQDIKGKEKKSAFLAEFSTRHSMTPPPQQQQNAPLTPLEQEYVQEHEEEMIRDGVFDTFIERWTNKSRDEQSRIIRETPKGEDWKKRLIEKSADYILLKAKRMTDTELKRTLNNLRSHVYVAEKVSDILYKEFETREAKSKLLSE